MAENVNSTPSKPVAVGRMLQLLFVLWLFIVNIAYYIQFRDLFLARFESWIRLWR
jgi:hypothetical protein